MPWNWEETQENDWEKGGDKKERRKKGSFRPGSNVIGYD